VGNTWPWQRRANNTSMGVLLAGIPRCGSTWLANVLGCAEGTRTVFEPDGPISDVLGAMVATRLGPFPVLHPEVPSGTYKLVWDLAFAGGWPWDRVEAARAAGRRMVRLPQEVRDAMIAALAMGTARVRTRPPHVVVKSVNSVFSLEWIDRRYHPRIVVLRRNPLNVVSSWVVLDMATRWTIGEHPDVRTTYLEPLGLKPLPLGSSPVTAAAWNVGLLTLALKRTVDRHPEWIEVSYDDLSTDPLEGCKAIFSQLGWAWTEAAEDYLARSDRPGFVVHGGNPKVHPNAVTATEATSRRLQQGSQFRRRLSDDEIAEANSVLDRFPLGYWGPSET
jgi:hypothetical protein